MKILSLFLALSFLSLKLVAAPPAYDSSPYWANHFGLRLAKIKEPKDILVNLSFSARHLAELEKEVAKNSILVPEVTYKVYISQIFMIDANKKRTIVDFKKFKYKRLYLNGKPIYLKPDKTYDDITFEVAKILYPKKKFSLTDFIFNTAYAQSGEGDFSRYIASWFTSASAPRYLNNRERDRDRIITSTLIETYENEAELARRMRTRNDPTNVTSMNFMCDGPVMTQVVEYEMVANGRPRITRDNARRLINIPGGGYEFRYGEPAIVNSTSCSSQVDDNGLVQSVKGNNPELCPKKGLNIFNDPAYFGGFPRAAASCCRRQGCYEEVTANVLRIRQSLLGVASGIDAADPASAENNTEAPAEDEDLDNFSDDEFDGELDLESGGVE